MCLYYIMNSMKQLFNRFTNKEDSAADYAPEGLPDVEDQGQEGGQGKGEGEGEGEEEEEEELILKPSVREHPLKSKKEDRFKKARVVFDEEKMQANEMQYNEMQSNKIQANKAQANKAQANKESRQDPRKEPVRKAREYNDENKVNPSIQLDKLVNTFWKNAIFIIRRSIWTF